MNKEPLPSTHQPEKTSRREFLSRSGKLATSAALAGTAIPWVHAAEDNTIHLALIGCGGRGSGAVLNAYDAAYGSRGPVKLTVMADLYEDRLKSAYKALKNKFADKMDVTDDRKFVGFDAYRKAIDCLRPGDVAMLTGYSGFRALQLEYAVEKGINVFMEKSFGPDAPSLRRLIKAGEAAEKKNLKIAAGLQCRHSRNRQELLKRIQDGEMGDIQLIRAYRMQQCGWLAPRKPESKELEWQLRHFTHFLWVSGGLFAEMNIHQIDELCWIKNAWPVTAHGVGGRAANNTDCGQNLDSLSIEWTFPDGTKAYDVVRWLPKCYPEFATFIHGTKCAAQFSGPHHIGTVRTYKDQRIVRDNIAWEAPAEPIVPWQAEWEALLDAIRQDKPHNEAKRAGMSNIADLMGRAAVHSGQMITWDQMMNSNFQLCPNIDSLNADSPAPVKDDAHGRYPVPVPGVWKEV
ncbi:MAG: Gfo/Idh/MocA family oxidoreductase [Verrucomicrobia bacterium]|nr:Gfo/Idh/MocA family oxidoreductase [Verrucomicrobiota bacterium]